MMKPQQTPARAAPKASQPASANGNSGVQAEKRPPLVKRLPIMTDAQLASLRASAVRISADGNHPKQAAALRALPLIEAEIGRRATSSEARQPVTAEDE